MQPSDTLPLRRVGVLTHRAGYNEGMQMTNRLAAALTVAALAVAGCGGEGEGHGPGEAEHSDDQPGMTTPRVAEADGHEAGHGEEIGGSHGEANRGPGAVDAHDLELALDPLRLRAGETGDIGFQILDPAGEAVKEFEVEHTKQVHLILVSKDLRHFRHVHPRVSGNGVWRARVEPPAPGEYRAIADVNHEGRKLALTGDFEVGGSPNASGQPASEDAELVTRDFKAGQPVTIEFDAPGRTQPYLGAAGHLVILSEGDLEYLHVHPLRDELSFSTSFPKPGRYVMFLEYRRDGEVRVSRFEVTVSG